VYDTVGSDKDFVSRIAEEGERASKETAKGIDTPLIGVRQGDCEMSIVRRRARTAEAHLLQVRELRKEGFDCCVPGTNAFCTECEEARRRVTIQDYPEEMNYVLAIPASKAPRSQFPDVVLRCVPAADWENYDYFVPPLHAIDGKIIPATFNGWRWNERIRLFRGLQPKLMMRSEYRASGGESPLTIPIREGKAADRQGCCNGRMASLLAERLAHFGGSQLSMSRRFIETPGRRDLRTDRRTQIHENHRSPERLMQGRESRNRRRPCRVATHQRSFDSGGPVCRGANQKTWCPCICHMGKPIVKTNPSGTHAPIIPRSI